MPEKKPTPVGRRWKNLSYADFNMRFPKLGAMRTGMQKKNKRIYRYPDRAAPGKRKGEKYRSVIIPLETYLKIKELQKFYKAGIGAIIKPLIDELFDKTLKEAELLARIEANRKKDNAVSDPDKPGRRTHF